MPLTGKVAVVTGAGSGIGRATCVRFLRDGVRVALVGRREDRLHETLAAAKDEGITTDALVRPCDVADDEEASRLVEDTIESFGGVDILVNNAGIARFGPLEHTGAAEFDAMVGAHLRGPVTLIRAALPSLRKRSGNVVNVSSVGGTLSTPNRSLYGATKAGLNHLSRSLAIELAPTVRVNAVLPGPVDTPMYEDLGLDEERTRALRADMMRLTPAGRFGTCDEVANWVCRIADNDESGWVTGALISIDGGRTA